MLVATAIVTARGGAQLATPPWVSRALDINGARGSRLGVRLTSNAPASATSLYDLGFRRFTSSVQQAAELHLVFGRHALTGGTRG